MSDKTVITGYLIIFVADFLLGNSVLGILEGEFFFYDANISGFVPNLIILLLSIFPIYIGWFLVFEAEIYEFEI